MHSVGLRRRLKSLQGVKTRLTVKMVGSLIGYLSPSADLLNSRFPVYKTVTDTWTWIEALEEKVNACRNALFLTEPQVDRESLISTKGTRADGTCEWIIQNESYRSWLHGGTRLLWVSGGPGKGKTMLSIFLTEERRLTQKAEDAELVFFFCSHQDEKRNTAIAVLRGLLYQIVGKRRNLVKHVLLYFETPEKAQQTLSSLETLWIIFRRLVQDVDLGTMFCVLDGLDECDQDTLRLLVPKIIDIFSPENSDSATKAFKMVIVSRDIPGLHGCRQVKLDPDNDTQVASDIERFISARVGKLSSIEGFNDEFCVTVQKTLLERSEGTFLWAGFVINELDQKKTCTEVVETLESLPRGLPAVYSRMLLQIESRHRRTSSIILRWVAMAFRPLTLQELAAAIGTGSPFSVITIEQAIRDKIALCEPFLKVQEQRVGLVHQSARDYLLRKEPDSNPVLEEFRVKPEAAHLELARTCFDCVMQSGLQYAPLNPNDGSSSRELPLLSYATLHWPEHARYCSMLAGELLSFEMPFFQKDSNLRKNWWATYNARSWRNLSTPPLLHMTCHLGIVPWVVAILKKSWMPRLHKLVDKKDKNEQTALHWAAEGGHEAVVRLLVDRGADVNVKDKLGLTALYWAAKGGHEAVVRLLVDRRADVNLKDDDGPTALHQAAAGGHQAMVRLLVDRGADVNAKDYHGWTALYWAATQGHEVLVRLLIDGGADVNAKTKYIETALHNAAEGGHEAVARLLIDSRADVNAKTKYDQTALQLAAEGGHQPMVRLLVDRGADVNAKDYHDYTALHVAAKGGHEAVTRLLIDSRADVNAKTKYDQTALHLAALGRHEAVARLLRLAGAS
jgi:ankyrin repeat protein